MSIKSFFSNVKKNKTAYLTPAIGIVKNKLMMVHRILYYAFSKVSGT